MTCSTAADYNRLMSCISPLRAYQSGGILFILIFLLLYSQFTATTKWVSNPCCARSLHLTTSINLSDISAVIMFSLYFISLTLFLITFMLLFFIKTSLFYFIYNIKSSTGTLSHSEQCQPSMSNRSCWHMFQLGLCHIYIIIIYVQKFIVIPFIIYVYKGRRKPIFIKI